MRIGILGGTFNPVHIAHLRLGIESAEYLKLDQVQLMPCGSPAHKSTENLLPFEFRLSLLQAAIENDPLFKINPLEGRLAPPSYTWNSLLEWKKQHPNDHGIFILGAEDFANLGLWKKGLELPQIMDFAIMSRSKSGLDVYEQTLHKLWPHAKYDSATTKANIFPHTTACFMLMPTLDISASLVREKWRLGLSLKHLLPEASLELMLANKNLADACFSNNFNLL